MFYAVDTPENNNFNSHAPRGARLYDVTQRPADFIISTHTPREGRDQ